MADDEPTTVVLAVNGRRVAVPTPDPAATLLQFLRSAASSRSPKLSCGEGGCGACAVLCTSYDPSSRIFRHSSINACLAPLCSLDGCAITTAEGLSATAAAATTSAASVTNPIHPVQSRLASFHASQCGFCTPGLAVSLHSSFFSRRRRLSSASDAHHAVVGHICRCTGYRPILDACKSLAADADVEDLGLCFLQEGSNGHGSAATELCVPSFLLEDIERRHMRELFIKYKDGGDQERLWIRARSLQEAVAALREHGARGGNMRRVKVVAGNTSAGYYKEEQAMVEVFIDISRVQELLTVEAVTAAAQEAEPPLNAGGLRVGAAVTIEDLIAALDEAAEEEGCAASAIALHLKKVANPLVRHRASIVGNIVMAQNCCFDSDLVPLLLAIDAKVELIGGYGDGGTALKPVVLAMEEFLVHGFPEPGLLLKSVTLPLSLMGGRGCGSKQKKKQVFRSYRAAPRELGNALAFINAAFLVTLNLPSPSPEQYQPQSDAGRNPSNTVTISDARLAFGAFGGSFRSIRAHAVERFLAGKELTATIAAQAMDMLKQELAAPLQGAKKAAYRSSVAVSFLFDFLSQLDPKLDGGHGHGLKLDNGDGYEQKLNGGHGHGLKLAGDDDDAAATKTMMEEEICAGFRQRNPLETVEFIVGGKQIVPVYTNDDNHAGVGKPMQKSEAILQATGEAVYVDDIPSPEGCLYAGFVHSSKAWSKVKGVDAAEALRSAGVVAFISAEDIPKSGKNVGSRTVLPWFLEEPLFATDHVQYVGHLLGLVVADTPHHAVAGAAKVHVEYEIFNEPPILCAEDAEKKESFFALPPFFTKLAIGDADKGFTDAEHVISDGEVKTGSQYYFYMETQTALAIPEEDGCMLVYSSSQGPDFVQNTISECLGIPNHNVRVITRRVGRAFGGKAFRNIPVACACAVAAHKLRRPVRIYLDRKTDISISGGRHPTRTLYSVAFTSHGKLTGLRAQIFIDSGWSMDFSPILCLTIADGLKKYNWGALDIDFKVCKTNLCSKSAMRAPGHVQGSFVADTIMEHVAAQLGLDVHTVMARNLHTAETVGFFYRDAISRGYTLPSMWETMLKRVESRQRAVCSFNGAHKWQKRGISVIPCVYGVHQIPKPARVSIFGDGSIAVEVGGIEMGQGLWTKVKQATIYGLSSLCQETLSVRVVQADTISLPHGGVTADSTGSESSCEAVRQACQVLVERLMPLKLKEDQKTSGQVSWHRLIQLAANSSIDLSAQVHWFPEQTTSSYLNYGVAASEIELNVLTGAVTILRSDIMYDCGRSLNPAVDIGQIEGAFVQGIGFFLTEEYEVDGEGEVVSNSTWTYKPPTVDNIPRKFAVEIINGEGHQNRILSSKACGEPPLLLAGSVHAAVRHAIEAAREDRFKHWSSHEWVTRYFRLDTPATMEKVKGLCGLDNVEAYLKHLMMSHGV